MQAVHELGHILGARLTGGTVRLVALSPISISRTELSGNPRPLTVAWAGPVLGAVIPMFLWWIAAALHLRGSFAFRFFAGFCLVANGLYIGLGSFNHVGDCGEMLRHGSQLWQLWLFGLVTAPVGMWLWHGEGTHFGLGTASGHVDRVVAYSTLSVFLAMVVVALSWGAR